MAKIEVFNEAFRLQVNNFRFPALMHWDCAFCKKTNETDFNKEYIYLPYIYDNMERDFKCEHCSEWSRIGIRLELKAAITQNPKKTEKI